MNYKLHYDKLIEKARNRSILKSEYKETHHIIPKCIGGTDDTENLIDLFPEEHLVAHLLLVKIYPNKSGLVYAANMMTNGCSHSNLNRITNKKYSWLKKKHSKLMSNRKMSSTEKKKKSKIFKKNNPMFNKDIRDKIAEINKGKVLSEKTKEKISLSKKGKTSWNKGMKIEKLSGDKNPFYGKEHNDITKKKLSEIKSAQWASKSLDEKKEWSKKFSKMFKIISPNNETYYCDYGLKNFADEFNLGIKALIASYKNNRPVKQGKSKGWYVIEEEL